MSYYNYTYNNECHDAPQSIAESYYYVTHGYNFKTVLGDFLDYFYSEWTLNHKDKCYGTLVSGININEVDINNNSQACFWAGLADQLTDDFCFDTLKWTKDKTFFSNNPIYDVNNSTTHNYKEDQRLAWLMKFKEHNVYVSFDVLTRQGFYPMADKYNKPRLVRKALRKNKLDWYSVQEQQKQH